MSPDLSHFLVLDLPNKIPCASVSGPSAALDASRKGEIPKYLVDRD